MVEDVRGAKGYGPKHIKQEDSIEEKLKKLRYNAGHAKYHGDNRLLGSTVEGIVDLLQEITEGNN
ncbi:MAG: hypothetical protein R3251_01165 [Candidatus Spechtbacterales bacterium]|nr:hypothetical protein [Candidatus Spechtbacterales bacterium]